MGITDRHRVFLNMREEFPLFTYQSYSFELTEKQLNIRFNFSLANKYSFEPSLTIPLNGLIHPESVDRETIENLVFQIGMVELISYWKAACPPKVVIMPHSLLPEQIEWWKNLYFHGLGEFFYLNGIHTSAESFMEIESQGRFPARPAQTSLEEQYLVPVGGGKDSVVSLEILLKARAKIIPFIVNPRPASEGSARLAGFGPEQSVFIHRNIDPALLRLNEAGFLNGHTPFSALLAFTSVLGAVLTGSKHIALSNESSANESTVPGTTVNHQYSKSVAFEDDFRDYCRRYLHPDINYFSLLRPLNELQIVKIFSRNPKYFTTFKSCNVGSKTDIWCGQCPKCLFSYLMLSPFLKEQQLENIFGSNLLKNNNLMPILLELGGQTVSKPFECVGTVDEVNAAIQHLRNADHNFEYTLLNGFSPTNYPRIEKLLNQLDNNHHVSDELLNTMLHLLHD